MLDREQRAHDTARRYGRPIPDRLFQAAAFATALQTAASRNPGSWRTVAAIGKAAGIEDPAELAQAVRDAVDAGLVYHRVEDGYVLRTGKGRGVAAD